MKTRYEKHHDQGVMWTVEFYFKREADLEICCINKITTQIYWRCEK